MTHERDLHSALEAWMREDAPMPDDLDEVLRAVSSAKQVRRWRIPVPTGPGRNLFMFDATKFAAALAVTTMIGMMLAVAAPWERSGDPRPGAAMSEAEVADGRMLAVHDVALDDATFEAAVAAAYAETAFVRDVLPDTLAEADGLSEITAMIDREEVWTRRDELKLLDPLTDDLRYLGIYEVRPSGPSDEPARTVACMVTVADELIQARECSHGASSMELAPPADVEAGLEAADDRFLRALGEPETFKLGELVPAAFDPEAVFGVYWHQSRANPADDIRRGHDRIRYKFTDVMVAERLEPPMPLAAEAGSLRYLGTYDFTYDPGGGRKVIWPDAVCSAWLEGESIERMDCFLPADTIIDVAD